MLPFNLENSRASGRKSTAVFLVSDPCRLGLHMTYFGSSSHELDSNLVPHGFEETPRIGPEGDCRGLILYQ